MIAGGALFAVLLAGTVPVTDIRAPGSVLTTQPGSALTTPPGQNERPTTVEEPPPSAYDRVREHDGQAPETQSLVGQFIKTLVALAMVIALIWVIFKFGAARLLPSLFGTPAGGASGRIVRVVERVPIDQRSSLVVVDAGNERMLLGIAATGVSFIAHLDKTATPEPTQSRGGPAGFRAVLDGLSLKKSNEPKNPREDDDAPK